MAVLLRNRESPLPQQQTRQQQVARPAVVPAKLREQPDVGLLDLLSRWERLG